MSLLRPPRLRPGDAVAVLSPSWGGPAVFPHVFDAGLAVLRDTFGLRVREWPTTRAAPDLLARDPAARARDVADALADPEIRAIIASIGGDDSMLLLPHLDPAHFRAHPKVLMGYSDTCTLLVFGALAGVVTFQGPAVMAGFAQVPALPPAFAEHVRALLFDGASGDVYRPYPSYAEGYPDWAEPSNAGKVNAPRPSAGWRWLQGQGTARGPLFGGCMEVLEFLKGTRWWPEPASWSGRVLFLETSEESPPPHVVRRVLRNYGLMGALAGASALLFGRPRGYTDAQKDELREVLVSVIGREFGRPDLPIVADVDFGHTDPQLVLPLGVPVEIDCAARAIRLLEPAVA